MVLGIIVALMAVVYGLRLAISPDTAARDSFMYGFILGRMALFDATVRRNRKLESRHLRLYGWMLVILGVAGCAIIVLTN